MNMKMKRTSRIKENGTSHQDGKPFSNTNPTQNCTIKALRVNYGRNVFNVGVRFALLRIFNSKFVLANHP